MGLFERILGAAAAEAVDQIAAAEAAKPPDPMRWPRRIAVLSVLILGWLFIVWQNRFHVTVPVVVVCLGYLAVVATVFNLWRTGAVAVALNEDDEQDSTWAGALGARGELEREKKGLLRAIKEAEFDREMGKLSQQDCDEMIAVYRGRAIEVIKEVDKLDAGAVGTVREQIQREVKARLEIEHKTKTVATDATGATDAANATVATVKPAAKADGKNPARKRGKSMVKVAAATAEATAIAAAKAVEAFEKAAAAVTAAHKAAEVLTDASVPADVAAAAAAAATTAVAEAEAATAAANAANAATAAISLRPVTDPPVDAVDDAAPAEPKPDAKEATP